MDRIESQFRVSSSVATNHTRRKLFLRGKLHGTRTPESHSDRKNHKGNLRHRHNKYLYPIVLCLTTLSNVNPAVAETVGGVSATANPVANSSGSVTNQAIQVLQGPYITNTYGDGISCQGATFNFTPYVTRSTSWMFPYEPNYNDPVYNMVDLIGDVNADGDPIPDGIPDKPGEILYHRSIRTGQKDNYNWNAGFSATMSFPMDRKAQNLCKEAATKHNQLREQILANRRLEFEITRLKKCGELAQQGITFASWSPYHKICRDIVVRPQVTQSSPHVHGINVSPSSSQQVNPSLDDKSQSSALDEISVGEVSPSK